MSPYLKKRKIEIVSKPKFDLLCNYVPETSLITEIFTMTSYSLKVGIETSRLMLDAFKGSMERKRPIKY